MRRGGVFARWHALPHRIQTRSEAQVAERRIQFAGQSICLEEMLGRPVPKGAIFHASSHRRREVAITPELRRLVEETAAAIRAMLVSGELALPVNDARCRECSLKDLCQPEALAGRARQQQQRQSLLDPEE